MLAPRVDKYKQSKTENGPPSGPFYYLTPSQRSWEVPASYRRRLPIRISACLGQPPFALWGLHIRQPLRRFLGRLRLWCIEASEKPVRPDGARVSSGVPELDSSKHSFFADQYSVFAGHYSIINTIVLLVHIVHYYAKRMCFVPFPFGRALAFPNPYS